MASKEFVENFNTFTKFYGFYEDEVEALKIAFRGNMDAADVFLSIIVHRIKQDPAFGINERIRASIAEEKTKNEKG